jgi:CRP-like cAMP-binding protein
VARDRRDADGRWYPGGVKRGASASELLGRSPLWAALPDAARRELAARATRKRFRNGQRLLAASDRAVVTLVVGRADLISVGGDDGDDERVAAVIRSVAPPATVGISVALGAAASAELWAAEAGELLSIPGDTVARTIERHPDAAVAALIHLGGLVAELSASLAIMRRHGLVDRLRHTITTLAHGRRELAITHAALAAEVGGERANVSRALARLEADGFLVRRRGRLEIK